MRFDFGGQRTAGDRQRKRLVGSHYEDFVKNHPNWELVEIYADEDISGTTSKIKPRRFITKAVRKLKGLDDRAAQRFEEKLKT